jgi:hypothetical protein
MNEYKRYNLASRWQFNATPDQVWQAIGDPKVWSQWWSSVSVQMVPSESPTCPEAARCTWRTPLGYRLTVILTPTLLQAPTLSEFTANGELVGNGTCRLFATASKTNVNITWNVATTKPWMNQFAFLLGPAFRINHAWIMRSGEASLKKWLRLKYPPRFTLTS